MQKLNICAIIPARSGSKGVTGKNLRLLHGHPLLAFSIEAARQCQKIDRILVSTDGEEIANVVRKYGLEVPFLRPANLAQDRSPDRDYLLHALEWLKIHEGYQPDVLVLLRPTTPERLSELIDEAIQAFLQTEEASSLRSVQACSESPFKWFKKSEKNFAEPIVSYMTLEDTNKPRQLFDPVFIPNGYVDILRPSLILQSSDIYGDRIQLFETSAVTEIDTIKELETLKSQSLQSNEPLEKLSRSLSARIHERPRSSGRHVGLVVRNFGEMIQFYSRQFGFQVVSNETEHGSYLDKALGMSHLSVQIAKMVDERGWMLELLCFDSHPHEDVSVTGLNRYGYTHMALTVSDVAASYVSLVEQGLSVISEPVTNPSGTAKLFFCRDPEGNLLEIVQPSISN